MKAACALGLLAIGLLGCRKGSSHGTISEAKEVLSAFARPGADTAALTAALRPKPEDYEAVFDAETAKQMKTGFDPLWDEHKLSLKPTAEQTEVGVERVTPEDLKKGDEKSAACPPGYKDIADKLKEGTVVYCFSFTRPGTKPPVRSGLFGDGLVYVKDHWALFPKPWRFAQ